MAQAEKYNLVETEQLVEKWDDVLECKGEWAFLKGEGMSLTESKKAEMAVMCEQIEQSVKLRENTQSGDIQRYDPILIPVMRRVMPGLISGDIFGTQPLSAPTGLIFALRAVYQGNRQNDSTMGWSPTLTGLTNQILIFNCTSTFGASAFTANQVVYVAATNGATTSQIVASMTVVHVENQGNKQYVLVKNVIPGNAVPSGSWISNTHTALATLFQAGVLNGGTVTSAFTNEMQFKTILQAYSGGTKTKGGFTQNGMVGSGATDGFSEYVNEIGFAIDKTSVSVVSRKLKTRWTQELEEDLNAVHSINAEKTLQQIATEEISQGQNREMLEILDAYSVQNALYGTTDFNYGLSDGRWEKERYESLANHISRVRRKLALENRRGQANFMVVTSDLLTALEGTGRLSTSGNDPYTNPFVGTMDGMKVYCDVFRTGQEITLGYKGSAQIDAGFFYCPYVPLKVSKGMGQEDNNPRLFFSTRYGIGENPFGAKNYYTKFAVTGTVSIGQAGSIH